MAPAPPQWIIAKRTIKTGLLTIAICMSFISCREENQTPTCKIADPANKSVHLVGDVFDIRVGASDPDGDITEVQISINNIEVVRLNSGPYVYTVSTELFSSGTYAIRAVAKDNGGLTASDEIEIRVDNLQPPSVYTREASSISSISIKCLGHVSEDGGSAVTERGICWNMEGNPTLEDDYLSSGEGIGLYEVTISGLECNSTYYYRAYATNGIGTVYGDPRAFTTNNIPEISTLPVSEISLNSAECGGTFTILCSNPILAKGVCWSTAHNPTIDDMFTDEGAGPENFTSILPDILEGIHYYIRAYASVSGVTVYGEEVSIQTWANTPISDIDGNVYNTLLIGDQIWMVENLRVSRYADGSGIPRVEGTVDWDNLDALSRAYCWYDNDSAANALTYGALYTWEAATNGEVSGTSNSGMVQGVCPDEWHLPDDQEWSLLVDYLGGMEVAGAKMKEEGTAHWQSPNAGATNESGFTALPGGYRWYDGKFYNQGLFGYWRSSTKDYSNSPIIYKIYYDYIMIKRDRSSEDLGLSVRCVKD